MESGQGRYLVVANALDVGPVGYVVVTGFTPCPGPVASGNLALYRPAYASSSAPGHPAGAKKTPEIEIAGVGWRI